LTRLNRFQIACRRYHSSAVPRAPCRAHRKYGRTARRDSSFVSPSRSGSVTRIPSAPCHLPQYLLLRTTGHVGDCFARAQAIDLAEGIGLLGPDSRHKASLPKTTSHGLVRPLQTRRRPASLCHLGCRPGDHARPAPGAASPHMAVSDFPMTKSRKACLKV
jgi:hypothetical protein